MKHYKKGSYERFMVYFLDGLGSLGTAGTTSGWRIRETYSNIDCMQEHPSLYSPSLLLSLAL